jgi:hypothetical protein
MKLQDGPTQTRNSWASQQTQRRSVVGAICCTGMKSPSSTTIKHLADRERLHGHLASRYGVFCGGIASNQVIVVVQVGPYRPDLASGAARGWQSVDFIAKKHLRAERSSGIASPGANELNPGSLVRRSRWPIPVPTITSPGPWLPKMIRGCRTECPLISS